MGKRRPGEAKGEHLGAVVSGIGRLDIVELALDDDRADDEQDGKDERDDDEAFA